MADPLALLADLGKAREAIERLEVDSVIEELATESARGAAQ